MHTKTEKPWILEERFIIPAMAVLLPLVFLNLFLEYPSITRAVLSFICTVFSFSLAILWFVKIISERQIKTDESLLKIFLIPITYAFLGFVELIDFGASIIRLYY